MKNKKRIYSKLLIILIAFTLVFSQGSFAFAGTEAEAGEETAAAEQPAPKEQPKVEKKEEPKQEVKETPAEEPKETPKEEPKEEPKTEPNNEAPASEEPVAVDAGEPSESDTSNTVLEEPLLKAAEVTEVKETADEPNADPIDTIKLKTVRENFNFDNSTDLSNGVYSADDFEYVFEGGTGKAKFICTKIRVTGGKAYGEFTSTSANMTHVALSHTDEPEEDTELYDPDTDTYGAGVYPIENMEFTIPVKIGAKTEFSGRTTAMGNPHWIKYWYTITMNEDSVPAFDNSTTLTDGTYTPDDYSWTGGTGKAKFTCESVTVTNGHAVGYFTTKSTGMTHVYLGVAEGSDEITSLYDPSTGEIGPNVYNVNNQSITVPVRVNEDVSMAARTTAMSYPHWVNYVYNITIDESQTPGTDEDADYTAVDAALAKVPSDLSVYTDESVEALNNAIDAVVRGKKASEQSEVDAMAQAIEDAIAALEEKPADGRVNLTITNKTGMFKAVSAYLLTENGKEYIVIALSGTGYHELFKGTYEEAVANGDGSRDKGNNKWVHGYKNSAGKWEFKMPLNGKETYVPIIAISNTYYTNYLNGSSPLERAFFPRQFEIDRNAKTLVTDDYNETTNFSVTSKVADFKVASTAVTKVVGGPNSNNYGITMTLTMQDSTYDEVIYRTVKDGSITKVNAPIKNGKFTISLQNAPNLETFKDKTPIEMTFHVAADAPYKAAGKYVVRKVTVNKMNKTIVINGTALNPKDSDKEDETVDPTKPDKDDQQSGGGSGYAPAVDSSTTLKDGVYKPDSFSWSGGSGRLAYIKCTKITVRGGKAYATIVFASSQYDQLKASGRTYRKSGGGLSTFVIPVNLNANNKIIGRTTAMSQPHWIAYTIYIGLAETPADANKAQEAKKEAAEAKMEMSDEAPTIVGLEAKEDEDAVTYSKYFKLFNYEHGVKLLSIDISQDTELREEYTENAKRAMEVSESEDGLEYDDEGNVIAKSKNEYIEDLYKNNIVNYLLVPEDYEVPAGLDKEYIIVNIPSEKTFAASNEVIAFMEKLGCLDSISLIGIDEGDLNSEDIKKALEEGTVLSAGNLEKPDYGKVIKDKTELAILPGDLLPEAIAEDAENAEELKAEAEAKKAELEKLESRFTALEVPVIVDRSAQEEDDLAKAEWIKVYGALFGCEDEADKIFEEIVKEADKQ